MADKVRHTSPRHRAAGLPDRGLLGTAAVLLLGIAVGTGKDSLQAQEKALGVPGVSQPPPLVEVKPPPPLPPGGQGFSGFGSPTGNFPPPGPGGSPGMQPSMPAPAPLNFQFKIDPKTPLKDLLPAAPPATVGGPLLDDDLAKVPEVQLHAPLPKNGNALQATAHLIAKINHLNQKKHDAFLEALLAERADLSGLPMAMGAACRTKGEQSRQFTQAVNTVRQALQRVVELKVNDSRPPGFINPSANDDTFWERYRAACAAEDKAASRIDRARGECVARARIAALTQMLAPESPAMRLGLAKYLTAVPHVEATRALARVAIFSPEDEVRQAALDGLKVRREKDYTDILLHGLRYPLPAVAKRAGEAVVKLERADLIPHLVELLDEADPRAPVLKQVRGKQAQLVREVVRINHHRNCLMCHAPAGAAAGSAEVFTVPVPTPDQPLTPSSGGYGSAQSPEITVRLDVTYLRQDFSVMQPVADAQPWPEMQRFDFLVRTRVLTDAQAETYRAKLKPGAAGVVTPYQRAALAALRELTGRDTAPTAEAWRRLLGLQSSRRPTPVLSAMSFFRP